MGTTLFALNFEPFLSGVLAVVIGFIVWMGSVYLLLATNLGARLGFLAALAGLFGWMALMGAIWWVYGIGYVGSAPSWQPVPGRTVIQQVDLLDEAGVVNEPLGVTTADPATAQSAAVGAELEDEGWIRLETADAAFGEAVTSASLFAEEEGAFEAGQFQATAVYVINPPEASAKPKFGPNGEFDQLAFIHPPYYAVVEIAPVQVTQEEPGRAPFSPQVDDTRQRQYVYMIRDLGNLRQPAAYICISSTIIFLALCWMLNRRDRVAAVNLAKTPAAAS